MKLIVGLGNPGASYAGTRHNVGFDVVDALAKRWGVSMATEKFHGWFGQGECGGESTVLLKPTTFMNRSGRAVLAAGRFYRLSLEDLMVVTDDLALPLGRVRIRQRGSSGGHNGLQDIIDRLGDDGFPRTRLGIDEAGGDAVGHVLRRFNEMERPVMDRAVAWAAAALECWIGRGLDAAMNEFNGDPPA